MRGASAAMTSTSGLIERASATRSSSVTLPPWRVTIVPRRGLVSGGTRRRTSMLSVTELCPQSSWGPSTLRDSLDRLQVRVHAREVTKRHGRAKRAARGPVRLPGRRCHAVAGAVQAWYRLPRRVDDLRLNVGLWPALGVQRSAGNDDGMIRTAVERGHRGVGAGASPVVE